MQSPISIFLDTTFLIDLADSTRPRNSLAQNMMSLFNRHQATGAMFVYTSLWNLAEGHGALYEIDMKRNGTPAQQGMRSSKERRDIVPPESSHLSNAQGLIETVVNQLNIDSYFQPLSIVQPNFFELANLLATEHAIWPADSVHLAFALSEGCSLIISDDRDLADKIECASSFIRDYQNQNFSEYPLPKFCAAGLQGLTSQIPQRSPSTRETAFDVLRNLGFT